MSKTGLSLAHAVSGFFGGLGAVFGLFLIDKVSAYWKKDNYSNRKSNNNKKNNSKRLYKKEKCRLKRLSQPLLTSHQPQKSIPMQNQVLTVTDALTVSPVHEPINTVRCAENILENIQVEQKGQIKAPNMQILVSTAPTTSENKSNQDEEEVKKLLESVVENAAESMQEHAAENVVENAAESMQEHAAENVVENAAENAAESVVENIVILTHDDHMGNINNIGSTTIHLLSDSVVSISECRLDCRNLDCCNLDKEQSLQGLQGLQNDHDIHDNHAYHPVMIMANSKMN